MSARDELVHKVRLSLILDLGSIVTDHDADDAAHNVVALAEEHFKPRTITTIEELAEAHMVVVRTEAGTIANLVNGRAYVFGYEASAPVETLTLPVTVLWEREATA